MLCSRLAWIAALPAAMIAMLAVVAPAASACRVCDDVVELDLPGAKCFIAGYENFLSQAHSSAARSAQIDLTGCAGSSGDERRGLDRMTSPFDGKARSAERQARLRSVYILDAAGIECLKRLLDGYEGAYDPARFDLYESCGR